MPKKWITFGLLGLAGWWLWKNAKKNNPVSNRVGVTGLPVGNVLVKEAAIVKTGTLPPVFKNTLNISRDVEVVL